MHRSEPQDSIDSFTLELFRAGVTLTDLVDDLTDALPDDAYPDEDPGEAILEMVEGSIRTFLEEEDAAEVRRATELIAGASDRVGDHLELALELRRRTREDTPPTERDVQTLIQAVDGDRQLDELDRLVVELLDCGACLSQIVINMAQAAGDLGPDGVVGIPDSARQLVRTLLDEVTQNHSEAELSIATGIVAAVNDTFTNDVFILNPDVE